MSANKTILITGANSGIGQQTAYLLAKDKCNLILTYYSNEQAAQQTKEKCLEFGAANVEISQLDLTNQQSIQKLVDQVSNVDILINNAAYLSHGDLKDVSLEDIERQLQTNLVGTIKLTKLLLPKIKKTIVNIGSNLGLFAKGRMATYCATKFGLRGFSKSLAKESHGRKVYLVAPPATKTQMGTPDGVEPQKVAQVIYNTASGKYNLKTGAEVYYIDYQYGAVWAPIIHILRKIKNIKKI